MNRVVLLFLHGGGYTKECWNPIIKRLERSTLLQRVPSETVAFDWRFHGEKSDHSVVPTVTYLDDDKAKPRADHALREWPVWGPQDVRREIDKLRAGNLNRPIVAIGHSMGATAMLQVEIAAPGTFQGLIAFEPIHKQKHVKHMSEDGGNMLVSTVVNRPGKWNSWDEVLEHFKTGKMYRRWAPESMDAFLEQGVRRTSDGSFVLATAPHQEAAIYCHTMRDLDFANVGCHVTIEHAERSFFFNPRDTTEAAKQVPHKLTVAAPIPKTSHSMVVEDPDTCAEHILQNLAKLPLFQESKL